MIKEPAIYPQRKYMKHQVQPQISEFIVRSEPGTLPRILRYCPHYVLTAIISEHYYPGTGSKLAHYPLNFFQYYNNNNAEAELDNCDEFMTIRF